MTQSQRSRYLKTGGLLAFLVLLLFLFTSRDSAGVRDLVKGRCFLALLGEIVFVMLRVPF